MVPEKQAQRLPPEKVDFLLERRVQRAKELDGQQDETTGRAKPIDAKIKEKNLLLKEGERHVGSDKFMAINDEHGDLLLQSVRGKLGQFKKMVGDDTDTVQNRVDSDHGHTTTPAVDY
jgi:hypothetical protein